MPSPRVARGRETERLIAADLQASGCPDAKAVAASVTGYDIHGWPGVAVEVKARYRLNILAALKQAKKNAGAAYPLVIARMNGQGPEKIDEWVSFMFWGDMKELFREAGYLK